MLIIILLLVTRAISEKVYLQATVLFYGDEENRTVLITGPVPEVVNEIITRDLNYKTPSNVRPIIKVVPVYKYDSDIPSDNPHDIYKNLLKIYPNLVKAVFPEDSRKYIKFKAKLNLNGTNVNGNAKNSEKKENGTNIGKNKSFNGTTTPDYSTYTVSTPYYLGPENFVPNDIYYAVEKKCANWAENCDQRSGSILSMPYSSLNMPNYFFMKKIKYDP